jgi:hypothetical protein
MRSRLLPFAVPVIGCLMVFSFAGCQSSDNNPPPAAESWNTFLGSDHADFGCGIVADGRGNVYVAGYSYAAWGTPIRPYSEFNDTFVAKLDRNGNLVWSTLLGPTGTSGGHGCSIAIDSQANIYVTGLSLENWGSPINPHVFGYDTFVAKLDSNGNLVWNTFLNSQDNGWGGGIALNGAGDIFVTGGSTQSWGSPVRPFAGGSEDVFVARLSNTGHLVWNSFLGSDSYGDDGNGVAADSSGNVWVVGNSCFDWGSPIRPLSSAGSLDAFVAKLDANGNLVWNTFLGTDGGAEDYAEGVVVDGNGAAYVVGTSKGGSWGSPVRAYTWYDAYVAKLDGSGALVWNTFLGSSDWEDGKALALDSRAHVFVAGDSYGDWGPGAAAYHEGGSDAFVAELDADGNLLANTFLGSSEFDYGEGIALDAGGRIFLAGTSEASWGNPVRAYTNAGTAFPTDRPDAFAAKLTSLR